MISSVAGSKYSALTVKSRRRASSSCVPNTLSRSTRPCSSFSAVSESAARNVDVSTVSAPIITCTRRKRRPMTMARRNSGFTSSGRASVTMSKSLGGMSSSRSRTAPPTTKAQWPAWRSTSHTLSALWLMAPRRRLWRSRGTRCGAPAASPSTRRMKRLIIAAAILTQRDHRPPAARGFGRKRHVGVDGNGVAHASEQGQVVVRIAVEDAVLAGLQPQAEPGQPLVDALDLALAKARRAGDAAGEAAVHRLGLGRDEVRHAEFARDRRRDEAVGGGDHGAQVAGVAVARHQLARAWRDHRQDARAHEIGVPARELLRAVRGERTQREAEVLVDVERARLVLLVVLRILRLVLVARQHAAIDQELAPLVVAVAGEQRVVEVEQGQVHGSSERKASRTSGSVIGRCCSSEARSSRSSSALSECRSRRTCVSRYQSTSSGTLSPRRPASARRYSAF